MSRFYNIFPHYKLNKIDSKIRTLITVLIVGWGINSLLSIYYGIAYIVKMSEYGIGSELRMIIGRFLCTGIAFGIFYYQYYRAVKNRSTSALTVGFVFIVISLSAYLGIVYGVIVSLLVGILIKKLKKALI